MKKIITIYLSVFVLSILFVSCEDDNSPIVEDEITTSENYLKIGEVEYKISDTAYGYDQEHDDGIYLHWLQFVTDGINILGFENEEFINEGFGQVLEFAMLSSTRLELPEGEYPNIDTVSDSPVNTFDFGNLLPDWDKYYDYENDQEIYKGTVKVLRDGVKYEIIIDCVDSNGISIKGYYKGELKIY